MQITAKPLSVADLIQGPAYLWLQVHPNGVMMVAVFTVIEMPTDGEDYLIDYIYDSGKYHLRVKQHEFDGSGATPSLFPNYSRIFLADDSLYDRLYHIAFYQKLDVWLEYLGVENPDQVDASMVPRRLEGDPALPAYSYLPGQRINHEHDQVFEPNYADLRPYPDVVGEPFRPHLRSRISHPGAAPTRMQ